MVLSMKCAACGLTQMPGPACKSCGRPLGGPAPRPSPLQSPQQELARFRGVQMENQDPEEKPKAVKTAVNALWASLAVGLVKALLDFAHISAMAPAAFIIIVWVTTIAFIAFLIAKISAGRNWARIVLLILFALGILPALYIMSAEFARVPVMGALSLLQMGMQVYALFLLFTQPGSVWFRKAKFA